MLVFEEGGKLEYPEKNQQQTQPKDDAASCNPTQDTSDLALSYLSNN